MTRLDIAELIAKAFLNILHRQPYGALDKLQTAVAELLKLQAEDFRDGDWRL